MITISDLMKSCVKILYQNEPIGTGFFILPEGYIITCFHIFDHIELSLIDPHNPNICIVCIDDPDNKDTIECRYIESRSVPSKDIAILKVKNNKTYPFVPLADNEDLQVGQKVYSYGYQSLDYFNGFPIYGEIMGYTPITKNEESDRYIVIGNTNVEEGSSGSPLFDISMKKVVGIVHSYRKSKNQALAIPINEVFNIWDSLKRDNEDAANEYYVDSKKNIFVQKIADLLKLLGYQVKTNVLLVNDISADIIANFKLPGGSKITKIFIECIFSNDAAVKSEQVEEVIYKYREIQKEHHDIESGRIYSNKIFSHDCRKLKNAVLCKA